MENQQIKRSPKVLLRVNGRMNAAGVRIKQRREELNLSQSDLCARLSDSTFAEFNPERRDIYRLEKGSRKISDVELLALALALDVSPMWLLVGSGDERSETGFRRPLAR